MSPKVYMMKLAHPLGSISHGAPLLYSLPVTHGVSALARTSGQYISTWHMSTKSLPSSKSLSQSWHASSKLSRHLECIALKATTLMQTLLLQKPSHTSKSKDHITHLQRRMELWSDGDIQALLDEGKCIQKRLSHTASLSNSNAIAQTFRNLMLQGKFQSALRYLSRNTNGGVPYMF